ncbi:unnamed protein product [Linum trigynum]|uniref:Uncharacterized protein n=1 Tax=Linum trigynum TaxID=586398 RepID=A0AAV2F447_9ROSI
MSSGLVATGLDTTTAFESTVFFSNGSGFKFGKKLIVFPDTFFIYNSRSSGFLNQKCLLLGSLSEFEETRVRIEELDPRRMGMEVAKSDEMGVVVVGVEEGRATNCTVISISAAFCPSPFPLSVSVASFRLSSCVAQMAD